MDKKDIFFDTNIIKLRGEWFDTCYITAAYDVEAGELVYDSGAVAAYLSVWGVALEKARKNEPCLVIYKADRIMLPYYTNTNDETDILNDYYLVNEIGNPQPISGKITIRDSFGVTYVMPAAVQLSWANQEYGHAILLEMPEHSPYYLDNGEMNFNPKYGLFELLGGIRKRKNTHWSTPRVT
jgi:hypothetical protein